MGIKDKTGKFIKYEVESLDIPNDEWLTDHLDVIKGCSEDWLKDCKDEDRVGWKRGQDVTGYPGHHQNQ